ncbi:hypothetical protein BJV77DRAFT_1034692, partial [Russula vinacea]
TPKSNFWTPLRGLALLTVRSVLLPSFYSSTIVLQFPYYMVDSSVVHTNVHALSFSYHTVLTIILNVTHLIH